MTPVSSFPSCRTERQRDQLLSLADQVSFPPGTRMFDEGEEASRFWVLRNGTVALDVHVPGRRPPVIETLGPGDLVGWSWLFTPYRWHLGAVTLTAVTAHQFAAEAVRALCARDTALGYALTRAVAAVIGHRLRATRVRLLDLYGPPTWGAG